MLSSLLPISSEPLLNRRSILFTAPTYALPLALILGTRVDDDALAATPFTTSTTIISSATGAEVRGTPITPFNSLMFQYRGSSFTGLKATDLNGVPSISYKEFIDRMNAGDVSFVEFLAPYGDAAFATIKDLPEPIRIGEGYPIEQHDGYSSPAFAIRAVKNAGVPYTFTVPGVAKFSSPKN